MMHFNSLANSQPSEDTVIEESRTFTRSQLSRLVNKLAHVLASCDAGPGSRIAWMMPNRAEVIVTALSAQRLGAALVPLSYRSTPGEVARMIGAAQPTAIVCDASTRATVRAATGGDGRLGILDVDGQDFQAAVHAAPDRLARSPATGPNRLGSGASLFFTSGTTGTPKVAVRTRGDVRLGAAIAAGLGFTTRTRYLPAGPLYHSGPGTCALMALSRGGAIGLLPRFEPADWLCFAQRHRMTAGFITPTQLRQLVVAVENGAPAPPTLANLVVSGEPFPAELKRRAVAALGSCLIDCYGATELGPISYMSAAELLSRPASCGRPFAGVEVAAFRNGTRLGSGQTGTLRARTPLVFDGYLRQDGELTRPGEWASVGDIGYVDADGYVYVTDRVDDLIISGGVNVSAAEVSAVLAEHPQIERCAVLGVPDGRWGQAVCAVAVAFGSLTIGQVRHWLRGRIADDKRPHWLILVPELPTTGTGKVSHAALRDLAAKVRSAGSPSDQRS